MDFADQLLLGALLLAVVVTTGGFVLGRRRNRRRAMRVARELEAALLPVDCTYTWIGGLIGFHAVYEVDGFEEVKATCTLMPRHSLLYMPLALLLGRGDRVHVTFYLRDGFESEGHVIRSDALRSPLLVIEGREKMVERTSHAADVPFVLMGTNDGQLDAVDGLLREIARMGIAPSVRHVALVPGLSTLYAQVVPDPGVVEKIVQRLRVEAAELTARCF